MTDFQVMPPLTTEEYEELRADIKTNGVQVAVEMDEDGNVLDGYHRKKISEELGIDYPKNIRTGMTEQEKIDFAIRINLNRRQLSKDQRRELSLKLRQQGWSYRRIGDALNVGIGTAYRDVSAGLPNGKRGLPAQATGKDGKQYPATKPKEGKKEEMPVTKAALREAEKYVEAVERYPHLATLPHRKAIKEAQKLGVDKPQELTEADRLVFLLQRLTMPVEEARDVVKDSLGTLPRFTTRQVETIRKSILAFQEVAELLSIYLKNN